MTKQEAALLREIVGNPFRPAPTWIREEDENWVYDIAPGLNPEWLTPAVLDIARTIYEDRCFEEMPVLADALEEAGCTGSGLLMHLRGLEFVDDRTWATQPLSGPHVRSCWALDMLLGKE